MTTTARVPVRRTAKLYIAGEFPRSESGRSYEVFAQDGRLLARAARASRKDLRDAVRAARAAQPEWAGKTAYNRGQILYRVAELMEGRRSQFEAELADASAKDPRRGVDASIDRWVWYAGWADKIGQLLGATNPVAGPYFNFTIPEPTGVVGIVGPPDQALLGLVSRLAPADVPGGVVNVLTGLTEELVPWLAGHMDVNAIDLTGVPPASRAEAESLSSENVKRVVRARDVDPFADDAQSPYEITALMEFKTVWHPMG